MRRRDLVKGAVFGSLAVAGSAIAGGARRLYGPPGSAAGTNPFENNRLRLMMARADLPVEVWEDIVDFSRVWSAVCSGQVAADTD